MCTKAWTARCTEVEGWGQCPASIVPCIPALTAQVTSHRWEHILAHLAVHTFTHSSTSRHVHEVYLHHHRLPHHFGLPSGHTSIQSRDVSRTSAVRVAIWLLASRAHNGHLHPAARATSHT